MVGAFRWRKRRVRKERSDGIARFGTSVLRAEVTQVTKPRQPRVRITPQERGKHRFWSVLFVGGSGGIRTPVGLHPNGFQDRLVMTASIRFRFANGTGLVRATALSAGQKLRRFARYIIAIGHKSVNKGGDKYAFGGGNLLTRRAAANIILKRRLSLSLYISARRRERGVLPFSEA